MTAFMSAGEVLVGNEPVDQMKNQCHEQESAHRHPAPIDRRNESKKPIRKCKLGYKLRLSGPLISLCRKAIT